MSIGIYPKRHQSLSRENARAAEAAGFTIVGVAALQGRTFIKRQSSGSGWITGTRGDIGATQAHRTFAQALERAQVLRDAQEARA